MRKIVFFDIDGTLYNTKHVIPQSAKEAIWQLQKNDVHVAIATGRPPFRIQDILDELGLDCYVCFNGNYCVYDGELLHDSPLPMENVQALTKIAKSRNLPLAYESVDEIWNFEEQPILQSCYDEADWGTINIHDEKSFTKDVYSVMFHCDPEQIEDYIKECTPFGNLYRWNDYGFEVNKAGMSKATGIEIMIQRLGYRMEDTYAFGDGSNDIEMLQTVGTGVAMGNAILGLKKHADFITKHVDEDGVSYGLKQLGLI